MAKGGASLMPFSRRSQQPSSRPRRPCHAEAALGEVQGRVLDSAEFRPLPVQGGHRAGSGPGPINTVRNRAAVTPTASPIRLPPLPALPQCQDGSSRGDSIAARWSWRGRNSTRMDTRSGIPRSATARPSRCTRAWCMALKYKESVTGDAHSGPRFWPRRPGTRRRAYARKLLIKRGDTREREAETSSARLSRGPTGWWRSCTIEIEVDSQVALDSYCS